MKLLEDLDRREIGNSGNKVRFALFECEFCKNQIIKQINPAIHLVFAPSSSSPYDPNQFLP